MTLKNNSAPLLCCFKLCASFYNHRRIQTAVTDRKRPIWIKIGDFVPCDLEIWWMTLENNRASLLCCFKLCESFQSHRWIQTGVTVRKRPIRVKIGDFLSPVTLQFDEWPWKTIGHIFYITLSFVLHFKALGEFELELQSGKLKMDSNRQFFSPCDLEIWWMTSKNYRAPLLDYIKLCSST